MVKCLNWADKKKIKVKFSKKRAMAKFCFPAAPVYVQLYVDVETGKVWADLTCRGLWTSLTAKHLLDFELKDHYKNQRRYLKGMEEAEVNKIVGVRAVVKTENV